ncbi:hypothetical protein Tco_0006826 [Tanacetum coccineum]
MFPLNLLQEQDKRRTSLSVVYPSGKSNLLFTHKRFKRTRLSDIITTLSNTNFFQAFTASANVPAIYLQQFWKTIKALAITPVNPAHPLIVPPSSPWLNHCLTEKDSGSDKPRHPVLQMLWGIVTQTNVDHAELIWEEFTQGIQTFFSHKASHKASLKNPKKKVTPLLIPYGRWLQRNTKKTPQGSASVQPATQRATPKKPTTTTPVKQTKPAPPPTKKPSKRKLPQKIRKGKPAFQLVDEDDEAQQESNPQEEGNDPELELAKKLSLETHQEKGEGDNADLERAIKLSLDPAFLHEGSAPYWNSNDQGSSVEATPNCNESSGKGKGLYPCYVISKPPDSTTGPSSQPDDDTSEKVIHESSSTSDSERTESETEAAAPKGDQDQGEVDSSTVTSGVSILVSTPETRT